MPDSTEDSRFGSKDTAIKAGLGTMIISADPTPRSPCVILGDSGVSIMSSEPTVGINVGNTGVSIQGKVSFSSSGKNITKGIYTENDSSAKPFTYSETVQVEGMLKEAIYSNLGKQGVDISKAIQDGIVPLMTNVSFGPLPHIHTMLFKHVHKVEPAYLYKVSSTITNFKTVLSYLRKFLAA